MLTIEDAVKDLIDAIAAEMTRAIREAVAGPEMRAALIDAAIAEMKAQHKKDQSAQKSAADVAQFDAEATAALHSAPPPISCVKPVRTGALHATSQLSAIPPAPAAATPLSADTSLGAAFRKAGVCNPVTIPVTPLEYLESQWPQERDDLLRKLYCDDGLDPPAIVGPLNEIAGPKVNAGVVTRRILFLQLRRATKPGAGPLPIPADIHQIRNWASQRGIQVDTAADVAVVNRERQKHNMPPFALKLPGWINS